MPPSQSAAVAQVFARYPPAMRDRLMVLRQLVFDTAAATAGVGPLEETLRWGEAAYITAQTRSGSTVRIAWKPSAPTRYAMYFHCQTTLVETFRTLFPDEFKYEGCRAIVFEASDVPPLDALSFCIGLALTYHLKK